MKKIKIDGKEVEVSDEIAAAIEKLNTDADALKGRTDALAGEADQLKADVAAKDAQLTAAAAALEDAKTKTDAAAIATAVKARVALVDVAGRVLDADTLAKLDEMDDTAVKKAVILARCATAKLDEASDVYVQARFDAVVEALPAKQNGGNAGLDTVVGKINGDSKSVKLDADASKKKLNDDLTSAWKNK